jgi:hypothetical protein
MLKGQVIGPALPGNQRDEKSDEGKNFKEEGSSRERRTWLLAKTLGRTRSEELEAHFEKTREGREPERESQGRQRINLGEVAKPKKATVGRGG